MEISLNGDIITTKSTINVLGIIFDAKLQWGPQVSMAITKASRALNAICLIRNYFNTDELLQLITSNFYSILFYNSEVWHLQTLNQSLKNALMSISAKAIWICTKRADTWMLSFINLHEMAGRATPNKIISYKLALQLYRTFNDQTPTQASRSSANACSYHKPSTKLIINGQMNLLQSEQRANEWLKLLWQNNFIISLLQTDNNYIWWQHTTILIAKHICWPTFLQFL